MDHFATLSEPERKNCRLRRRVGQTASVAAGRSASTSRCVFIDVLRPCLCMSIMPAFVHGEIEIVLVAVNGQNRK